MNKIIVLKAGTNTLVNLEGSERLNLTVFNNLASQVRSLRQEGYGVVLVSSGAITAGMIADGQTERSKSMLGRQRHAGIGWPIVAQQWSRSLKDLTVFSTLLTRRELGGGEPTRKEALNVINLALKMNDVVLINENDVITHEEIEFGDNDTLAALLASALKQANHETDVSLVLLTDVNGLRTDKDDPETLVRIVEDIEAVRNFVTDSHSSHATGGMVTKIGAAKIAKEAGVAMYITDGRAEKSIERTLAGKIGTVFKI